MGIQREPNRKNNVEVDREGDQDGNNNAQKDNHVDRFRYPKQGTLDDIQGQCRSWSNINPPLSTFVQTINRFSDEVAGPEQVEANDERVAVVYIIRDEQLEKQSSQDDWQSNENAQRRGSHSPETEYEEYHSVSETRWQIDDNIVIPDIPFCFFGFEILGLNQLPSFFVKGFTFLRYRRGSPHVSR
jgi:hypothetical protein